MATQDVVGAGHRWQVGDGTSIQIWRDKWLPKPSTFQVISMPNTLLETAIRNNYQKKKKEKLIK